jgi:hypothetical protein
MENSFPEKQVSFFKPQGYDHGNYGGFMFSVKKLKGKYKGAVFDNDCRTTVDQKQINYG